MAIEVKPAIVHARPAAVSIVREPNALAAIRSFAGEAGYRVPGKIRQGGVKVALSIEVMVADNQPFSAIQTLENPPQPQWIAET
jgi:hypothetical protein